MKRLNYSIEIDAPASKVWDALWSDENYRNWTTVFCEGSYAESNWQEGGRIRFMTPSLDGMYSIIAKMRPNEVMAFSHIGNVKNGEELPVDDETRSWSGAQENYYLSEENNRTTLNVEVDVTEDHVGYFESAFPKGLQKVKEIAES